MTSILDGHSIIPVVAIEKVEHAIPLAETLLSGGISVLEITLRTDAAIESITKIINSVPELIVGSGTVCNEKQFKLSQDIGCKFIVSPGLTPSLLDLARESNLPLKMVIPDPTSTAFFQAHLQIPNSHHKLELTYSPDFKVKFPEDLIHVCIRVDDIVVYCEMLEGLGLKTDLWPTNWRDKFKDGKRNGP